jgi:DNA-binding CsgD family transcriptional regulator
VVAYGWQHVAAVAVLRGDEERAAEAAEAATAAAPGNRDVEALVAGGRVLGALTADRLEDALSLATRFSELARGSSTIPPAHHRAAWPLLLAVMGSEEAPGAIEEIEKAGVSVSRGGRAWLHMARAVVTGRTDADAASALAEEADSLLVHMPVWRSLGRRLAAQAAASDGWPIPGGWLAEAEACLRSYGYDAPATACRRLRLSTPAGVPPAWARLGITKREADVLALVMEGCSNRDIAERLYLSVRTVEKHVEALLRKTATRSRTQLVRLAAAT